MTITTIRAERGKLNHGVKAEIMQETPHTFRVTTYCGVEMSGGVETADSPDDVTCAKCERAVRRIVAAELARFGQELDTHGEPTVLALPVVLSSPETTREPRQYLSPGRRRHGMIRHERAMKRQRMKAAIQNGRSGH